MRRPTRLPSVRRITTHTWHHTSLRKRVAAFFDHVADVLEPLVIFFCGF